MSQLVEMGFQPAAAEQALADSKGDVGAAVAILSSSAEADAEVPLWRQIVGDANLDDQREEDSPDGQAGGHAGAAAVAKPATAAAGPATSLLRQAEEAAMAADWAACSSLAGQAAAAGGLPPAGTADVFYLQGRSLAALGHIAAATTAIQNCLTAQPAHTAANDSLVDLLTMHPSGPRPSPGGGGASGGSPAGMAVSPAKPVAVLSADSPGAPLFPAGFVGIPSLGSPPPPPPVGRRRRSRSRRRREPPPPHLAKVERHAAEMMRLPPSSPRPRWPAPEPSPPRPRS